MLCARLVGLTEVRRRGAEGAEEFEMEVPAEPWYVSDVRRSVREWLTRGCGCGDGVVGELELVVSELVTNSILYSGADPVVVWGRCSGGWVRLEVRDGCPAVAADGEPDLLADGGRGLVLVGAVVRALGGRWACAEGVGVWVEVPLAGIQDAGNSRSGEA
ncbi:ATP-binding protein [Streptomyces acidiscabies]|uniref:ATP-binding protein n=1 Tax=Streptomyces acidiscabies TaxID=42234 RepID=UPI0015B8071C|nr:ATP-binding protein [Streptomyces acidiscabies]